MDNQHEYITHLESETGLKCGKDFGFIEGTTHPFKGTALMSVSKKPGYEIWKIEGGIRISVLTPFMSVDQTILFLKTPAKDINKMFIDRGLLVIEALDDKEID